MTMDLSCHKKSGQNVSCGAAKGRERYYPILLVQSHQKDFLPRLHPQHPSCRIIHRLCGSSQRGDRSYRLLSVAHKEGAHARRQLFVEGCYGEIIQKTHAFVVEHDMGEQDEIAEADGFVVGVQGLQHVLATE